MRSDSRYKRHATQYRGITYRERANGARSYYVFAGGRQIAVPGDLNAAKVKQSEFRSKAAKGEPVTDTKLTFGEVAELWYESKERRLRPWTLKGYRASLDNVLLPRWGKWKLAQISTQHVAGLIRELEAKGNSRSTIDNHLKALGGPYQFAMSRGLVGANPLANLTVDERPAHTPRAVYSWSPESVEALLAASRELAPKPTSRFDQTPLLTLAVRTGLRLGELLGLCWQDVELGEAPSLHVRRQLTRLGDLAEPKTAKAKRRIPLSPSLASYLRALKLRSPHSQDEDYVFTSNGKPLTHHSVQRRFQKAARAAGLEGVSFHSCRHAAASSMIAAGLSSVVVAAVLGHSSSAITERVYIHLFNQERTDDQVRAAMEGMGG
jgi:integrase